MHYNLSQHSVSDYPVSSRKCCDSRVYLRARHFSRPTSFLPVPKLSECLAHQKHSMSIRRPNDWIHRLYTMASTHCYPVQSRHSVTAGKVRIPLKIQISDGLANEESCGFYTFFKCERKLTSNKNKCDSMSFCTLRKCDAFYPVKNPDSQVQCYRRIEMQFQIFSTYIA